MYHFKGKQFQKEVIIVAVGYYLRYNLSYREVQEILYDRGIHVCHTTIYRWVQEYGKLSIKFGRRKTNSPSIRGRWTKLISKSKGPGTICIARSMQTV